MRGALTFGVVASVDGPVPAGEAVAAAVILALGTGIVVDKASKDIAGLVESTRT